MLGGLILRFQVLSPTGRLSLSLSLSLSVSLSLPLPLLLGVHKLV